MKSVLYIISTPIGNLADISLRAIETLKSVDIILCEDTRVSKKLLDHYFIKTKIYSFHQYSGDLKIEKVITWLKEGKSLALISDAGTPSISDPGARLVKAVREKLTDRVDIISIPGPSALTAALSISGFSADKFVFLGFLPNKKGRKKELEKIVNYPFSVVLYESKHRLLKLLNELNLLEKEKELKIEIFLAKELTKKFEKSFIGRADELIETLSNNTSYIKGEFVLVLNISK